LQVLGRQRLIDRAEAFARQWSDILAVSVREPRQVGRTTLVCIADEPGVEGPLGGLAAALRFADDAGCEAVLTIPADMPFLPMDLAERLAKGRGAKGAALARSGGHVHPVCGLWSIRVLDLLSDYLASERRSLRGLAETVGYVAVDWPSEPMDPFFNINSAEDLAQAGHLLEKSISLE
jgi:molybdopterin-guanine dinucleotide biosynthesis protein A